MSRSGEGSYIEGGCDDGDIVDVCMGSHPCLVDCRFVGYVRPIPSHFNDWANPDGPKIVSRVSGELGPLHTRAKSHDHEIVRA